MEDFKLIVYSAEDNVKDEIYFLNELLATGLVQLHLRKPKAPPSILENLILNIDPRKYSRIVLHSHYSLLERYSLKGIHLTRKYLEKAHPLNLDTILRTSMIKEFSLSKPVHGLQELSEVETYYDFVTISPLFDSISKEGYKGREAEFQNFRSHCRQGLKVYALGGINTGNIQKVRDMGFDGAAVMGCIWKSQNPVLSYQEILKTIESIG
jgi:thiamine-phosphate pyrophosphorylase